MATQVQGFQESEWDLFRVACSGWLGEPFSSCEGPVCPDLIPERCLANLAHFQGRHRSAAPTVTVAQLSTELHSLGLSLED